MKIEISLLVLWWSQFNCRPNAIKKQFSLGILDFKFPNESARIMALSSGSYIPQNNDINAIRVWKGKIFASVFRLKVGVASSFNYFPLNCNTRSPLLIPYPSFDANYVSEDSDRKKFSLPCDSSIISAAYFQIDKCDRLWVTDSGLIDYFGERDALTPPALVIFDLNSNKLLRRYQIPAAFVSSHTTFVTLDVDVEGNDCNNAFAYMADVFQSIIVYSYKTNRSWRLTHQNLGSNPRAAYFHYEGVNYYWCFGIFAITIGELHSDGSRRVYLEPFASTKTYYVSNKLLQNENYIALNNPHCDVHLLGDRGKRGQIYSFAYDEQTNILFDAKFHKGRVGCWNTDNPFKNPSFGVIYKSAEPFYPVDLSIDRNRNLWILSNNYPLFAKKHCNWQANEKNIQIYKGKVDDVVSGTVCHKKA